MLPEQVVPASGQVMRGGMSGTMPLALDVLLLGSSPGVVVLIVAVLVTTVPDGRLVAGAYSHRSMNPLSPGDRAPMLQVALVPPTAGGSWFGLEVLLA